MHKAELDIEGAIVDLTVDNLFHFVKPMCKMLHFFLKQKFLELKQCKALPLNTFSILRTGMTLQEFRSCSKYVQQQLVKHQGTFLLERKSLEWNILLFQLEAFYIEVYYERKTQTVELLKSFDDVDELDPYLRKIDILPLLN